MFAFCISEALTDHAPAVTVTEKNRPTGLMHTRKRTRRNPLLDRAIGECQTVSRLQTIEKQPLALQRSRLQARKNDIESGKYQQFNQSHQPKARGHCDDRYRARRNRPEKDQQGRPRKDRGTAFDDSDRYPQWLSGGTGSIRMTRSRNSKGHEAKLPVSAPYINKKRPHLPTLYFSSVICLNVDEYYRHPRVTDLWVIRVGALLADPEVPPPKICNTD